MASCAVVFFATANRLLRHTNSRYAQFHEHASEDGAPPLLRLDDALARIIHQMFVYFGKHRSRNN